MAKSTPDRSIRSAEPVPAIKIGALQEKHGLANRGFILTVYMRLLAVLWIGEGLVQWANVLSDPGGGLFSDGSLQQVSAIVFFCILDLIAAVGLWMATPWGGVVWLVTVGGQLLSIVLLPGFWSHAWLLGIRDVLLVAGYLVLAYLAGRQIEDENRGHG